LASMKRGVTMTMTIRTAMTMATIFRPRFMGASEQIGQLAVRCEE
jgi:hypothetical protein